MSSPTPVSTSSPVPPAAVAALRRTVVGAVVYPADPAYAVLLGGRPDGPARPAVVVEATSEADVVAALVVARTHGLALDDAGPGPWLLVRTDRLDTVSTDPGTGLVSVGAGARDRTPAGAEVLEVRVVRPDGFVLVVPADTTPLPDGVVTGVVVRVA